MSETNSSRGVQAAFSLKQILPILLAVASGMFLVILDSTIMNVAVPKLVSAFDTNLSTIQWVITAYTLSLSAVIPLVAGSLTVFRPNECLWLALCYSFSLLCCVQWQPLLLSLSFSASSKVWAGAWWLQSGLPLYSWSLLRTKEDL